VSAGLIRTDDNLSATRNMDRYDDRLIVEE